MQEGLTGQGLQITEKTKQMKARRLPIVMALLIGAGLSAAAAPAAAQGAAAQGKGDPKAGQQKNGACTGCHSIPGYKSSYPMVYSVPMIHGQSGKYIENALGAYRSGDRNHPTMRAIAGSLSDQDIADLAAYYGQSLENK
jgi:cytochrome c553